jgi:hypothetical protein
MKYEVVNSYERTSGSSLKGHIEVTYPTLTAMFGLPMRGDGDKTQVEWVVEFYDEQEDEYVLATIYDWKQNISPHRVWQWNVGGFKSSAVNLLNAAITEFYEERLANQYRAERTDYDEAREYDDRPLTADSVNRRYADSVGMSVRWR